MPYHEYVEYGRIFVSGDRGPRKLRAHHFFSSPSLLALRKGILAPTGGKIARAVRARGFQIRTFLSHHLAPFSQLVLFYSSVHTCASSEKSVVSAAD